MYALLLMAFSRKQVPNQKAEQIRQPKQEMRPHLEESHEHEGEPFLSPQELQSAILDVGQGTTQANGKTESGLEKSSDSPNVHVDNGYLGLNVKGKSELDNLSGKMPTPVEEPEKILVTESEPKIQEPAVLVPPNQDFEPELFISYKRDPASLKLVQALKTFIRQTFPSVKVLSDEEELKNGDSIKAYMDRLTKGDYIIFVLSAEFLESPWCMYELALTADYPEYEKRVFQIRFPGLQISSAIDVAKITKRWQDKWKELRDLLAEIAAENADHVADELKEDLRIASEIVKCSGKALSHMRGTIGFEVNSDGELDYEKLEDDLMRWFMLTGTPMLNMQMAIDRWNGKMIGLINEAFDQGVL
jgi:hypothetical protein